MVSIVSILLCFVRIIICKQEKEGGWRDGVDGSNNESRLFVTDHQQPRLAPPLVLLSFYFHDFILHPIAVFQTQS